MVMIHMPLEFAPLSIANQNAFFLGVQFEELHPEVKYEGVNPNQKPARERHEVACIGKLALHHESVS